MADRPMKVSWRKPDEHGENSYDSALTVMNLMLPIKKLQPFEDPSKLYPWMWITHCEMYLSARQIPQSRWISTVYPLLHGNARTWFNEFFERRNLSWEAFRSELCERFGDEDPVDVVRRYREIKQREGELPTSYFVRLSEMRNLAESLTQGDGEKYFLYLFVSGLDDEVQYFVRLLEPTDSNDALLKAIRATKFVKDMKMNIHGDLSLNL